MSPIELARRIAALAGGKGAQEIVALEVGPLVGYTDAIVICTARNERQAKAICDEVQLRLKREDDVRPERVDGLAEARWILLDYLDVILHVFVPETRERYRLEQLWGEAPEIELELEPASSAGD
jgi:ribosome-associated protein